MVLALRAGFVTWNDNAVPVVVRVPVTATNLSGLETVSAAYECTAPITGDAAPKLVDDLTDVVGPSREPCAPFARGRELLFWFDLFAGLLALAITFAHVPREWRDRR